MITQARSTLLFTTPIVKGFIQAKKGRQRRRAINFFWLGITGVVTVLALVPLFWIIGYVAVKGAPAINLAFFTELPQGMGSASGGVLNAIEGTVLLTVLSGLFAIPPGLLAAFYAVYHPNTWLGIALRFGADVLSGVPSIVIGLFGYALVVKPAGHFSALAGSIALAVLMLPIIIRTAEEMIKLVPKNLRAGALALGSPEWRAALQVTLPAAISGIMTGFLLGLARVSGETAPLLFTSLGNDRFEIGRLVQAGFRSGQSFPEILYNIIQQPVDSLPLTLYKYTQQPFPAQIQQAWGVALVLIVLILMFNIAARYWVSRQAAKNRG
ncbi:MAG: phosphate ABC transporter permease PstA [Chloroflexi bacterium]|nr:phosphate ABC transporter permease PstA [Chloroflexota bacterium]